MRTVAGAPLMRTTAGVGPSRTFCSNPLSPGGEAESLAALPPPWTQSVMMGGGMRSRDDIERTVTRGSNRLVMCWRMLFLDSVPGKERGEAPKQMMSVAEPPQGAPETQPLLGGMWTIVIGRAASEMSWVLSVMLALASPAAQICRTFPAKFVHAPVGKTNLVLVVAALPPQGHPSEYSTTMTTWTCRIGRTSSSWS
eukprot:Rmarinus@m.3306